jgi:DNA-binding IclR family transcriptional regulator
LLSSRGATLLTGQESKGTVRHLLVDGTVFHQMRVVKSQLAHCLELLSVMADEAHGMRLTDVATALGAPKSSTQRLLDHLAHLGWVEQDAPTGHYRLTMRLAMLGQRYLQSAGVSEAVQGVLDRLARRTHELARLTMVDGRRLAWIASAQGGRPGLRYEPAMGTTITSFATANGKAWLATLPEQEAVAVAKADGLGRASTMADLGPNALTNKDALLADLALVRERGYAVANEEAEPGVAALAVAITDTRLGVVGTTSIAGPVVRITEARYPDIVATLSEAASELAKAWPRRRTMASVVDSIPPSKGPNRARRQSR